VLIWRLAQHALIWIAASAIIVFGMTAAYAFGFNGHRPERWPIGLALATVASIFAGALVQRAPQAVVLLVFCAGVLGVLGAWLLLTGTPGVGAAYAATGTLYLAALAPSSWRWLRGE
jgi:hypothetical protein